MCPSLLRDWLAARQAPPLPVGNRRYAPPLTAVLLLELSYGEGNRGQEQGRDDTRGQAARATCCYALNSFAHSGKRSTNGAGMGWLAACSSWRWRVICASPQGLNCVSGF